MRWLTEADVVGLVTQAEAIDALETGLARLHEGGAATLPKAMHAWSGGSIHALGAFDPVAGLAGFKTWIHTPGGAVALLVLFDVEKGAVRAVIEAGSLGALRTAGVTGLATRLVSAPEADDVAIIGSGRQALQQLGAVALVRPVRRVRFWSPTPERRALAARTAAERFGLRATAEDTLEAAVADASIVTTVTRAKEPFLRLEHLARGAHLNAVGAILPGFAELHPDVLAAVDELVADSPAGVAQLREVTDAVRTPRIRGLAELLADGGGVARPSSRLTAFKSVGIGASDLAVAAEVLRRAESRDIGRAIAAPVPVAPRWR